MGETLSDVNVGALKPTSVGGVVWMDADDDGRRQNGDAGVQGVTVQMRITDGADAGTTLNATTDASGSYCFDGVMPGRAELSFTLADGYAFAKNASGTRRVSVVPMADSVNGQTDGVDVLSGENNLDLDVGVVAVGTMAGTVWQDSRYDGVYGKKEAGVSGAQVELLDAASGETLKRAETDENGRYALDFVRAGDYTLRVTLPDGMMFTCGRRERHRGDGRRLRAERGVLRGDGRKPRGHERRRDCGGVYRRTCDRTERGDYPDAGWHGGRGDADGRKRRFRADGAQAGSIPGAHGAAGGQAL